MSIQIAAPCHCSGFLVQFAAVFPVLFAAAFPVQFADGHVRVPSQRVPSCGASPSTFSLHLLLALSTPVDIDNRLMNVN